MKTRTSLRKLLPIGLVVIACSASAQQASIKVDAAKVLNKIPHYLYGSCIEDVNHEVYGGLYDERVYGESFEEPAPQTTFKNWMRLPGPWRIGDGGVPWGAGPGFCAVRNISVMAGGSIEADISFKDRGRDAGFLFRVNGAVPGSPYFKGYRLEVHKGKNNITLKKCDDGCRIITKSNEQADISTTAHLKLTMHDEVFIVQVDGKQLIDYKDNELPVLSGRIGIFADNDAASFKNLTITTDNGETIHDDLQPETPTQVSFQWEAVNSTQATYSIDTTTAFTGKQSQVIEVDNNRIKAGIANAGLNHWGISVKKAEAMKGLIYLKTDHFSGKVIATLENRDGSKTYATADLGTVSARWQKHAFSLLPNSTDSKARLVIYLKGKGKVWLDQAMLFSTGQNQFKGLPYRADIATAMQKEGLRFLRYGGTMANAPEYLWKNMTGPADHRPPFNGHWYPYASNGFGIEEFVKFCEAAGFEPVFAINVEEKPEDVANMVEYLTGQSSSAWGAKRAAAGHPKPYGLHYIELGNEEVIWGDNPKDYQHYTERFNILNDAIHSKNPGIKTVCSAWWRPNSVANMEAVFKAIDGKASYWDLHTDADEANAGNLVDHKLQKMQELFHQWNPNTGLKCAIFEENGGLHNMQRTLGHATTLNAVRRHGDFVLTSCPANALQPYQQNDDDWDQGQIFFTPDKVWGMPPFYAQQMAAKYDLPLRVADDTKGPLDVTATRSATGDKVVIHVVNTSEKAVSTAVLLNNFSNMSAEVTVTTLSAVPDAENTPDAPRKVAPVSTIVKVKNGRLNYTFQPDSYTILAFRK